MRFTSNQIELARMLHDVGLNWTPAPGQFVYDDGGLIEQSSPFQPGVYFILDLGHFLRRAGSMDTLRANLFWLPQWHESRQLLRELGMTDGEFAERMRNERVLEFGRELETLYEWIHQKLDGVATQVA